MLWDSTTGFSLARGKASNKPGESSWESSQAVVFNQGIHVSNVEQAGNEPEKLS